MLLFTELLRIRISLLLSSSAFLNWSSWESSPEKENTSSGVDLGAVVVFVVVVALFVVAIFGGEVLLLVAVVVAVVVVAVVVAVVVLVTE